MAQGQVGPHGVGEQERLLENRGHYPRCPVRAQVRDVHASEQHTPGGGLDEAAEQGDHRALTRPGGTDHGNRLARLDLE